MIHNVWPDAAKLMLEANEDHAPRLAAMGHPYQIALLGAAQRIVTYIRAPKTTEKGRLAYTDTGNSIFLENTRHAAKFTRSNKTMHRLDDLLAARSEPPFDLIKLDVQGAEMLILNGAPRYRGQATAIQLERAVQQYNLGAPSWSAVQRYMDKIGFAPCDILESLHKRGVLVMVDILFMRKDSDLHRRLAAAGGTTGTRRRSARR
jgi:FkbM family methyltransferase